MSSVLNSLTVNTQVTQLAAATADTHLVRLGEARALVSASIMGTWGAGTT